MQAVHTFLSNSWNLPLPNSPSQLAKVCYTFFKEKISEYFYDPIEDFEKACTKGDLLRAQMICNTSTVPKSLLSAMLFEAIKEGNNDLLQFLLQKGADPNFSYTSGGITPLLSHLLYTPDHSNYEKIALLLVEYGGDLFQEIQGCPPNILFCLALKKDLSSVIQSFVQNNPRHPIIVQAQNSIIFQGDFYQIFILAASGHVNDQNSITGQTILHETLSNGNLDLEQKLSMSKKLLLFGPDQGLADNNGVTPRQLALQIAQTHHDPRFENLFPMPAICED